MTGPAAPPSLPWRRSLPAVAALALLAAAGLLWWGPAPDPMAGSHQDLPLRESPLAISMELEGLLAPVEPGPALAFAEDVARSVGGAMLDRTGASSAEAAEAALWAGGGTPLPLVEAWAAALREREVSSRTTVPGLWSGAPTGGPRHVHPDELPVLLLDLAWRLDLRAELARLGDRLVVRLREPGGARFVDVEPTCFRCGTPGAEAEPAAAAALVLPAEVSSGARPLGLEELPGELFARAAARHDLDPARLEERLGSTPADAAVAGAVFARRLASGIAAWERGDRDTLRRESAALAALREVHGGLLPAAPDERVLEAMVELTEGDPARGRSALGAVLAHHEPAGPVARAAGEAHLAAMWLELEFVAPTAETWAARAGPLRERWLRDPAGLVRLCALGRDVLRDPAAPADRVPECGGGRP